MTVSSYYDLLIDGMSVETSNNDWWW